MKKLIKIRFCIENKKESDTEVTFKVHKKVQFNQ